MNASLTDSDQDTLSTHVAADQGAYHVSIDAGPYHIAYADVRPTRSSIELRVATGNASPRIRRRLIDAVFDLDDAHTSIASDSSNLRLTNTTWGGSFSSIMEIIP